jgi:hypothetical protein
MVNYKNLQIIENYIIFIKIATIDYKLYFLILLNDFTFEK